MNSVFSKKFKETLGYSALVNLIGLSLDSSFCIFKSHKRKNKTRKIDKNLDFLPQLEVTSLSRDYLPLKVTKYLTGIAFYLCPLYFI